MLNIAICDDEPLHLKNAEKIIGAKLEAYSPEIDTFPSAESLLQSMSAGDYTPDIAVLDIELGGTDGISLAKELNRIVPRCRIIFLTNYINYAPNVYFTDHTWFVMKSDIENSIGAALEKAIISLSAGNSGNPSITVKSRGMVKLIPVSQVLFIELVARKTRIVTETGDTVTSQMPKDLLKNIPESCIVRCHQSIHVNIEKIVSFEKNDLVLSNGCRIPVSRTYKADVKNRFFSRLRSGSSI